MDINEGARGDAGSVLAIWHDVTSGRSEEFESWHSSQHLPERVTIPGISRARRFRRAGAAGEEYCSVLDISDTSVLVSQEYLRRLNAPTRWTVEVSGTYENFFRCAVTPARSQARGRAPYLLSVRVDLNEAHHSVDEAVAFIWDFVRPWRQSRSMFGLSLGPVEAAVTSTKTSETTARSRTTESVTDLVLFAETSDLDEASTLGELLIRGVESRFRGSRVAAAPYRLQLDLDEAAGRPIYQANLLDPEQYEPADETQ